MKKLLALVLALVMSLSLVTISNAAFKDGDKINADYNEAVDVMVAVGVLKGYDNGNFGAKDTLTREQAAKIIAYLELGEKAADALVGGATFTDVAASRWSAGFVGYCAQAGVVNGVGNGAFDPAGQLTALQFGKMLLVELGYDAKAEKMIGNDWAINTSKLMATAKLMDGIEGSVNQVLTREQAAQMCLNAIEAPMVTYETKGSSISVNGAEINFGASVAKYETSTIAKDQNISRDKLTSGEYTVELGEKLYKDLKKASIQDNLGRPATKWTWKADEIDTYADKADKTYSKNVKLGDIYKDLGMSTADDAVVYIDGIEGDAVRVSKANTVKLASKGSNENQVDTGTTVEVYFDDSTNDVTICVIHNYAGTVEKTVEAKGNQERHIIINDESDEGVKNFKNKFETEDTVADDTVVSFTFSQVTKEIQSVTILESVTGVLTKKTDNTTDGKSVYLDGNEYKVAKGVGYDGFKFSDMNIKSEFTAYLDEYNNVIYVKEQEYVAGDYALILNIAGNSSASFFNNRVKLLTADGLVKTYDTDKDYTKKGASYEIGEIVTYKVDATSKEVTLNATETGATHQKGLGYKQPPMDTQFQLKNNDARIKINGTAAAAYANSKTVFVVYDGDDYKAYTGIKSAPSIEATATAAVGFKGYCRTDNLLTVAFIDASASGVKFDNKDIIYLAGASKSNRITDGDDVYYTYNAVVNGKITETPVKVAATGVNYGVGVADGSADTNYIFNGYNDNKYDVIGNFISFSGDLKAATVKGTVKLSGEYTIGFGTDKDNPAERWTVSEKANIYKIDADGVITEAELKSITTDANDQVIYTYEDGQITNLFVQEIDDKVTDKPVKPNENVKGNLKFSDATLKGAVKADNLSIYSTGYATFEYEVTRPDYLVTDNSGNKDLHFTFDVYVNGVKYASESNSITDGADKTTNASWDNNSLMGRAPIKAGDKVELKNLKWTNLNAQDYKIKYVGADGKTAFTNLTAGAVDTVVNATGTTVTFRLAGYTAGKFDWKITNVRDFSTAATQRENSKNYNDSITTTNGVKTTNNLEDYVYVQITSAVAPDDLKVNTAIYGIDVSNLTKVDNFAGGKDTAEKNKTLTITADPSKGGNLTGNEIGTSVYLQAKFGAGFEANTAAVEVTIKVAGKTFTNVYTAANATTDQGLGYVTLDRSYEIKDADVSVKVVENVTAKEIKHEIGSFDYVIIFSGEIESVNTDGKVASGTDVKIDDANSGIVSATIEGNKLTVKLAKELATGKKITVVANKFKSAVIGSVKGPGTDAVFTVNISGSPATETWAKS
ncbi:S-layer homology domain-containing protein [Oscillibacter valericigenes]|nr:S-layer homology domain-containing protein [Oscillibacter valericigenes]